MINQNLVQRLLKSIDAVYARCSPYFLYRDLKPEIFEEISSGVFAIKFNAEKLAENIAGHAPELQKLHSEWKETRAALAKTQTDLKQARDELRGVQNELDAKQKERDKVIRDLLKQQAEAAKAAKLEA